jgi:hypothetical protein
LGFVGGEAVNIAVLERSFRKRDLLGIGIHQQCAFAHNQRSEGAAGGEDAEEC